MVGKTPDIWSKWLLERRCGGDAEVLRGILRDLGPVRKRILKSARLRANNSVLDVGCGDGFVGFGALSLVPTLHVVFVDVSESLLGAAREAAIASGVSSQCEFVVGDAQDLKFLRDGSVDAIVMRSVLIYVKDKRGALAECFRILRPGGRLSIYEPINTFRYPEPDHTFGGYDVAEVGDLAARVKDVYLRLQVPGEDPMLDFDERSLFDAIESVGFTSIFLNYHASIYPKRVAVEWETLLNMAANPKALTLKEAVNEALTSSEGRDFLRCLEDRVKTSRTSVAEAGVYLWAKK